MFGTIKNAACPVAVYVTMYSAHLLLPVHIICTANKIPEKITEIHLVGLPAKEPAQVCRKCWFIVLPHLHPLAIKLRIITLLAPHTREDSGFIVYVILLFTGYFVLFFAFAVDVC